MSAMTGTRREGRATGPASPRGATLPTAGSNATPPRRRRRQPPRTPTRRPATGPGGCPSIAQDQLPVRHEELLDDVRAGAVERGEGGADRIGSALPMGEVAGEAHHVGQVIALDDVTDRLLPER